MGHDETVGVGRNRDQDLDDVRARHGTPGADERRRPATAPAGRRSRAGCRPVAGRVRAAPAAGRRRAGWRRELHDGRPQRQRLRRRHDGRRSAGPARAGLRGPRPALAAELTTPDQFDRHRSYGNGSPWQVADGCSASTCRFGQRPVTEGSRLSTPFCSMPTVWSSEMRPGPSRSSATNPARSAMSSSAPAVPASGER